MENEHLDKLKILGSHIRSLREKKGYSQEALSFKADLHRTYVSQLELGQRNPSYITLMKLAQALSVSMAGIVPNEKNK
jgi:transcriptional regulator with XRE-family HTH domain